MVIYKLDYGAIRLMGRWDVRKKYQMIVTKTELCENLQIVVWSADTEGIFVLCLAFERKVNSHSS